MGEIKVKIKGGTEDAGRGERRGSRQKRKGENKKKGS